MALLKSNVQGHNIETIQVNAEEEFQYGYGYGIRTADFFNVFGIDGTGVGIFTWEGDPIVGATDYSYGYGYEYSSIIAGSSRTKKITIQVVEPVTTLSQYDLRVQINGDGYSDIYEGTTSGADHSLDFYVTTYDFENEKEYKFQEEFTVVIDSQTYGTSIVESTGRIKKENMDSFFDVIVEIVNTIDIYSQIQLVSSIANEDHQVSKTITAKSTVS